jgi:hypothetical protein
MLVDSQGEVLSAPTSIGVPYSNTFLYNLTSSFFGFSQQDWTNLENQGLLNTEIAYTWTAPNGSVIYVASTIVPYDMNVSYRDKS